MGELPDKGVFAAAGTEDEEFQGLKKFEDVIAVAAFVGGDQAQDGVECPDPHGAMVRNWKPLMNRFVGIENDVAAGLMRSTVAKMPDQRCGQFTARYISRQFHAGTRQPIPSQVVTNSSRRNWSRMLTCRGESKK